MRAMTSRFFNSSTAVLPYVWGFAGAAALDAIVDVRALFLPAIAVVSAGSLMLRRAGR